MANRIKSEDADDAGVLFRIELQPGLDADVRLNRVAQELADAALFNRTGLPATATLYEVSTNDPKSRAYILDTPAEKKITVRTTKGVLKEYPGIALKASVLQAYNEHAFSPQQ